MEKVFTLNQLNERLSKDEKLFLFEYFRTNPKFIQKSIDFALLEDKNKNFIPFWYLDNFFFAHEDLFLLWKDIWVESLIKAEYYGSKRSLLRLIVKKKRDYTEEQEGLLVDFAIKHLEDRFEEIAIHASCMKILCLFVPKYPELGPHIKLIVEEDLEKRSKAYKSVYRRLIDIIDKN